MSHGHHVNTLANETHHFVAKNTGIAAAKGALHILNGGEAMTHHLGGAFAAINANAGAANGLASAFGGVGGLVAIGSVGAISAAVAQLDYRHEITKMREVYREEIATKLGKPIKSVSDDDLYLIAEGDKEKGIAANKIIAEEISRRRSERTLNVALSAASTTATFLITHVMVEGFKSVGEVVGTSLGFPGAATAIAFGLEVLAGLGIYNSLKQPMQWLGEKIFGLDKKTTHDRIAEIKLDIAQGKGVTQEQVLDVFVSANKELDQFITKEYGKKYESMTHEERLQVVEAIDKQVPLAQMTSDINHNRYDAGELAFAIEGQATGFRPDPQANKQVTESKGMISRLTSGIVSMFSYKSAEPHPHQEAGVTTVAAEAPVHAGHSQQEHWHPAQEQKNKKSFVERYASGRRDTSLGHVERLEKARVEDPSLGSQQLA